MKEMSVLLLVGASKQFLFDGPSPAAVLAEPPAELSVAAQTVVNVPLRLLIPQLLLKLQSV